MLKCDDPDRRTSLFNAARQAVHDTVRATPTPAAGTVPVDASADGPGPGPTSPLTPAAIVAATTSADRALLDACTRQALRAGDVQAAARASDKTAFTATFAATLTTAISQLDIPADVARLAELHGDQAFRDGLTNLVWGKLTLRRADHQSRPGTQPVNAAAVAATAFAPAAGTVTAAPTSPAPATTHRVAHHDHAHVPER